MKSEKIIIGIKVTPFQKTADGWEENIEDYKQHNYECGNFLKNNGYLFVIEYDRNEEAWVLGDDVNDEFGDYFLAEDFEIYKDEEIDIQKAVTTLKLPVKIQKSLDAIDQHRVYIVDANGERILSMYHKDFNEYATCIPDAEFICKAINNYKDPMNL